MSLKNKIWWTVDVEELEDSNFNLIKTKEFELDYEKLIDKWLEFCANNDIVSTAFVLGKFAKKYPQIIKKLSSANHEIACHGLTHELVYNLEFMTWKKELIQAKNILEEISGKKVIGYRSPSWSLPFEKRYYQALKEIGFVYSSSYFPFKTHMYGHSIDKKKPFLFEGVKEIPVAKFGIPFSGGFYFRFFPAFVSKFLFKRLINMGVRPVFYIHPYELNDKNLFFYHQKSLDSFFAFFSFGNTCKKLRAKG